MTKCFFQVVLVVVFLSLMSCVTTTNQVVVNVDAAHNKRIELGMKYLEVGKRDNARFQFSKALKLKSKSAEAYQGIAMVHQANGELAAAESAFAKALKYANEHNTAAIEVAYGRYQMEVGKVAEACKLFEKAGANFDFKGRAEALYLSGKCAAQQGNKLREKTAFEHALNLSPEYPNVMIELADIYFTEGEYTKSKRLLDKLERISKPSARSLWLGIRIERIFGNRDKEASLALVLKNRHPYSQEYLEYKRLTENK